MKRYAVKPEDDIFMVLDNWYLDPDKKEESNTFIMARCHLAESADLIAAALNSYSIPWTPGQTLT